MESRDIVRGRSWVFWVAVALLLVGALSNLFYLWHQCPLDFSEDESHYWEWARHLDYGYYSKPPGIGWLMAGTMAVGRWLHLTGDGSGRALMPLLRTPAVVFGFVSGLLSLLLARRMFRDGENGGNRAALLVTLFSGAVPMFAVGSLLITIDSPMYLCWAATVYCLWRAVEEGKGAWMVMAGVACGVGMMFKPVLIALPLMCAVGIFLHPAFRRVFAAWGGVVGLAVVVLMQVPFVVWNATHGWVTFFHIGAQGGLIQAGGVSHWYAPLGRLASYVGGQAGGMGGLVFVMLVCAVVAAWRRQRGANADMGEVPIWRFLLLFALPLWLFYLLLSLWKATEPNWPAASYFAGMILLAGVATRQWKVSQGWRRWSVATIVWGMVLTLVAMNLQRFYPLAAEHLEALKGTAGYEKSVWFPGKWDPAAKKLRGFAERGEQVDVVRRELAAETGKEPLVISGRYDLSSSLAFYMEGHPFVYCIMSSVGGRESQYDLWPGLNEVGADGKLVHAGEPALLVGNFDSEPFEKVVRPAFERIEPAQSFPITVNGIVIRYVSVYKAYGFRGLPERRSGVY